MTLLSLVAADTGLPQHFICQAVMACPILPFWKRAGLDQENIGRNTTIVRSNYLLDGNETFYEQSLKLWEGLEQELNYNVMMSQRGIINLYHSDAQRDAFIRRGNAMRLHGADAKLLNPGSIVCKICPFWILKMRGSQLWVACCSNGPELLGMMLLPGAMRGLPISAVLILSKIVKSPTFIIKNGTSALASKPVVAGSKLVKLALQLPDQPAVLWQKQDYAYPLKVMFCKLLLAKGLKPVIPGVITFGAGHFYI